MKIETFKHENVNKDGTFSDKAGAVETQGIIRKSFPEGGCNLEDCNCSNHHWIMIGGARQEDGTITGMRATFDTKAEMDEFFSYCEARSEN